MVTVTVEGMERQVPRGTTYEAVIQEFQPQYNNMIALIASNGRIRELFKKINRDCTVTFFTLRDDVGHKTYVRTATMLFFKAVFDVFGEACARNCRVEFTVGNGSFVNPGEDIAPTAENAEKIKRRMTELVEAGTPFMKRTCPLDEAMDLFKRQGMKDKEKLFRYRMNSQVNIYEIEGYYDYYYGYMLPNAGYVKYFDVINYENGFMLLLPTRK
ncbi:MAG: nucleoside kinase, partial [Acetatifactor sp.]|nr:nucleoside kinase [Acetatifactor sp.]